jgi:hypothetical protein
MSQKSIELGDGAGLTKEKLALKQKAAEAMRQTLQDQGKDVEVV